MAGDLNCNKQALKEEMAVMYFDELDEEREVAAAQLGNMADRTWADPELDVAHRGSDARICEQGKQPAQPADGAHRRALGGVAAGAGNPRVNQVRIAQRSERGRG